MRKLTLRPEQILVPGEYELGDLEILEHYFKIFNGGSAESVIPVIVAHQSLGDHQAEYFRVSENNRIVIRDYWDKLKDYVKEGAEYFLLDGNHRAIASVLTHQPISTLQLEKEPDLREIWDLAEEDKSFRWPHGFNSLEKIVNKFEGRCVDNLWRMMTVKERVDNLSFSSRLPPYMKERYLKG